MQENFDAATKSVRCSHHTGPERKAPHRMFALRLILLSATLLLALPTGNGRASEIIVPLPVTDAASLSTCAACRDFDRLNTLVREGTILKDAARSEIPGLLRHIKEWYLQSGGKFFEQTDWIFPLKGYTVSAVGGGRTHGYLPKGYTYYDGNRHGGHPALDIFIHDRNQDDLDDRTGEYVAVLSIAGGIVVARETEWQEGSMLRGGKYLWIYDPSTDHLFYYAHLRELTVSIGAIIKPGDTLGFVGRTGLNAHKMRSPSHLHLTCLSTTTSSLLPVNIYQELVRARAIK